MGCRFESYRAHHHKTVDTSIPLGIQFRLIRTNVTTLVQSIGLEIPRPTDMDKPRAYNCPNCGAPLESLDRCSFCKTLLVQLWEDRPLRVVPIYNYSSTLSHDPNDVLVVCG